MDRVDVMVLKGCGAALLAAGMTWTAQGLSLDACDRLFRLSPAEKASQFAKMSPADLQDYRMSALKRLADISLEPPTVITTAMERYDYDKNNYAMNVGVAKTRGGRLWIMWVAGEDGPKARVVGAWSDDGGKTFTKPKFAIDGNFKYRQLEYLKNFDVTSIMGNLWLAPDGSLHMFVDRSICGTDGRRSVWQFICENPDDPEPKWSEAQFLWYGMLHNKPFLLKDGKTWMIQGQLDGPAYAFPELMPDHCSWFMASTDQGRTWKWRGRIDTKDPDMGQCEPMTIVREDGSLRCLIRTQKGIDTPEGNSLMESFSKDDGRTWTEPRFVSNLKNPASRHFFYKLANGHVVLVKHGRVADKMPADNDRVLHRAKNKWERDFYRRAELTAFLSRDDGQTWEGGLLLDERLSPSYPDGFQDADGSIYLTYDYERTYEGQICMAHFTEADILAGKVVAEGSFLKRTIVRPAKSQREIEAERLGAEKAKKLADANGFMREDSQNGKQGTKKEGGK